MDSHRAREILALYRPGTVDADEPPFAEALAQARRDPELARWLDEHCAGYETIRDQFRQIPVPREVRDMIVAAHAPRPRRLQRWWRRPAVLAAAASVVLALTLPAYWLLTRREAADLDAFRSRMVRSVLRDYRMDLETSSATEIEAFIKTRKGVSDYILPTGLEKLPRTGCGVLTWRDKPVTMVCFGAEQKTDLFLFILDRASVPDAPPSATPTFLKVKKLMTASWSAGGKIYVLAGNGSEEELKKLL